MALSRIIAIGDGSTTQFPLNYPLGILSRDHVTCRVGSEVDGLGDPVYRTLTWIHDGLVEVGGDVVAAGVQIVFDRTVPTQTLYHDYANGVPIMEANLDESNKQTLMAVHQVLDGRFDAFANNIDMGGFRLVNAGDAVDMQDIVTLQQLTDATGNAPAFAAIAQAAATTATSAAASASADADRAELAAASIPLSNYTATVNPTSNDDSSDGYGVGSEWWNTSTGARFGCINPTIGAATWVSLSADLSGLGSAAYVDSTDFASAAQGIKADNALPAVRMTNWVAYTPAISHTSGSMTNATTSAYYRRTGDTIEVRGSIVFTNTSAAFVGIHIGLPSGLTIDLVKNASNLPPIGRGHIIDAGNAEWVGTLFASSNEARLYLERATSTYTYIQEVTNNAPVAAIGVNDLIGFEFSVPITEWA